MKRPVVLGIAGPSDSGKTTLIEKLLPLLRGRGLVVSTIKHVHHPVEVDVPGKDSFRHRTAGADEVMIALPDGWVLHNHSTGGARAPIEALVARMAPCDLVLVEGYRDLPVPRIQVLGAGKTEGGPESRAANVVAVVGVQAPVGYAVPAFGRDDAAAIAEFIGAYARR